jgi:RNA polymerase sigma-70 factor (ECF subfamily)
MKETTFWNRIQQGDAEAFRQLYEQYANWLYGYGMKIAKNDTLVSEAIQSLFVYLYEKRTTCSKPDSIAAYLCISLRHILINELKKSENNITVSLDEREGMLDYQFDLEIDVEEALIQTELKREQLEMLQYELSQLTKQQREVIYLRYYKQLSPEETAQIMGLSSRTVYNTTHMAMTKLRQKLTNPLLLALLTSWIFN